ncbi:MAG: flavin reductase [Christensenellaceae bacterium]|nr:flavin reductase [Christensenellaceae bacterium]
MKEKGFTMYCVRQITDDLIYVGGSDRRLALFENVYPAPLGASFNAYVLRDEQTVLFDTADRAIAARFLENLEYALDGRTLDYLFVHHIEPDHSYALHEVVERHPEVKLVMTAKAAQMAAQFYRFDVAAHTHIVKEGDVLSTGRHRFRFLGAPMVHWPEVMFSYDETDQILFSADAFGAFGALGGSIFADEMDIEREWIDEMRRYYANIVGKYGPQVQAVLKKAATLGIKMICPLHGPIWRDRIDEIVEKYKLWSAYRPEEAGVLVVYASVYGGTENAAVALAMRLADLGAKVRVYDASKVHPSYLLSEAFRYSHLVLASATYNMGVFATMEHFLHELAARNLTGRTVALIENGSWAPAAGELMRKALPEKNTVVGDLLTIKSEPAEAQRDDINRLADAIAATLPMNARAHAAAHDESKIEIPALFKLSYGLFVLNAREGEKDNGCIINTVTQLTDIPKRLTICVSRQNLTHDMIARTGVFNISVLDQSATFDLFKRYGFQSGRDVDKFEGVSGLMRSGNGIYYLTGHSNAYLSCEVIDRLDYGTHSLFVADIVETKLLSDRPSVTYAYYYDHIKPAPKPAAKKGFVCKVCGYIYEGDVLPEDYICPICKHGAEVFEPLG